MQKKLSKNQQKKIFVINKYNKFDLVKKTRLKDKLEFDIFRKKSWSMDQ